MSALRSATRPIIAVTVVGTSTYYLYKWSQPTPTFDLLQRVKAPDGTSQKMLRKLPLLSLEEVDRRIRQNATSNVLQRPGLVWKYDTANLNANDPIEDAHAHSIIQRDPAPNSPGGDLLMFSIFDGHSGPFTSRLLAKTLIPAVALEISTLNEEKPSLARQSIGSYLKSFLPYFNSPNQVSSPNAKSNTFDADPKYVQLAIQTAFANLDSSIINAPIQILKELTASPKLNIQEHPMALASMLPALSGSCALLAVLDTARKDLYIACTGDSRAVAGYWDQDEDGKGRWRVEVLSEDQTGRNPNEHSRMQSEHPVDEAPFVIQRGRVLGGLEPTRAFGDARYKWPKDLQERLTSTLLAGSDTIFRKPPVGLKTPPYVTAQPVITYRKLSFSPVPDVRASPLTKSTLRFLVLATDGLWDALSSTEVVSLVGGHLNGRRGKIPKSELLAAVETTPSASGVEGKVKQSKTTEGNWAFVDDNIGAHLIRNAFGGADEMALRKLISIPSPLARQYRDDVTVTVLWWEDARWAAVKAKL